MRTNKSNNDSLISLIKTPKTKFKSHSFDYLIHENDFWSKTIIMK